jgi:hypothetical protein
MLLRPTVPVAFLCCTLTTVCGDALHIMLHDITAVGPHIRHLQCCPRMFIRRSTVLEPENKHDKMLLLPISVMHLHRVYTVVVHIPVQFQSLHFNTAAVYTH